MREQHLKIGYDVLNLLWELTKSTMSSLKLLISSSDCQHFQVPFIKV